MGGALKALARMAARDRLGTLSTMNSRWSSLSPAGVEGGTVVLKLKSPEKLASLKQHREQRTRLRLREPQVEEPIVQQQKPVVGEPAVREPESSPAPDRSAEKPTLIEQAVQVAMAAPPSTGVPHRPSTRSLVLKRKQESAVAGGRDVALHAVEQPQCCNCRVAFDLGEEFPPLSRIVCPRCDMKQVVPARIEHFVLERELGRGGMGVTYRAFDQSLQRNVAVKLISERREGSREEIDALVREARRAATLTHPHIVPIYSIGSVEGVPYVVMELLSDGLLLRPVLKGVAMDEVFVLETGLAVARALAEASTHGLLHLDVKPANILHDRFGVAKLIDFGLACYRDDASSLGWGTCLYMAPERLRRKGQDSRSDQYSLGLTLWHALAGRAPYEAPDAEKLSNLIVKTTPPLLNHLRPDILEWTAGLIHKMISHKPDDRYANYDQLIWAFEFVLKECRAKNTPAPGPASP